MNITQEGKEQIVGIKGDFTIKEMEYLSHGKVVKTIPITNPSNNQVGGYRITPLNSSDEFIDFMFCKKPSWIHRMGCKLVLGWTWIDKIN